MVVKMYGAIFLRAQRSFHIPLWYMSKNNSLKKCLRAYSLSELLTGVPKQDK